MNKFTRIAALSLLVGSALPALAVPALRHVRTVTQPDGTTLRIMKVGDERRHFTITEDGLLLAREADGTYCYARANAAGVLESTGLQAVDLEARSMTPAEAMKVSELDVRKMAHSPRRIPQTGVGLDQTTFPSKGTPNVLIVLVEYSDHKFNLPDPHAYFEGMLNEEGFSQYGGTGSCKDYFKENSMGQFVPHFDLYGPVTLPQKRSYYGGNDRYGDDAHPEEMVIDAIKILDPDVDFAKYDNDGDGKLDNVYVIYAGQGEASYGTDDTVWPHSWDLSAAGSDFVVDGVTVDHYACSNEWWSDRPDGIGTFVHEFSHVMGLPDLYSTDGSFGVDWTPDRYSVMDSGPYNNDGCTPPAYGLYERNSLGWTELDVIDGPLDCELKHVLTSNKGYIIPTSKNSEFFLLENRQQEGWDKYIPGHGMLIWHIDFNATQWANNTVNNTQRHQYVDIEEAGGRTGSGDAVQASYTFPGTFGVTSFTDDTTPSMKAWTGESLGLPVTEIMETDGVITFVVDGGGAPLAIPVPFDAERIEKSDKHFVAAWEPVENAIDYELSVYAVGQGEPLVSTCDMGSGKSLTLADGWTSNSTEFYSTTSNYGAASPSLKFGSTGSYLLSPEFNGNVTSISYWRKGQATDGSELLISGLVGSEWVTISSEQPASGDSGVVTLDQIPEGVRQVKFGYTKSRGNLAIDDVVITTGVGDQILNDYIDLSTGAQTSMKVDKLKEGCDTYRFKVRARGEKRVTRYSESVTVTLATVGISEIEESRGGVEYFDMLGRKVTRAAAGDILIERRGSETRKVVVR